MNDRSGDAGSRATQVGALVREDILAGRLEPGSRLTFPELCKVYDVSVGVLREALTHLVDRGVVLATTNLGFRVMELSKVDFDDLTTVRAAIEPQFLRRVVQSSPVQWEGELIAAHHLLTRVPLQAADGSLNSEWLAVHEAYHLALVGGTGQHRAPNDQTRLHRMVNMTTRLRDQADLYARWWMKPGDLARIEEPMAREHAAILEAALDRDEEQCELLLTNHIEDGARAMKDATKRPGELRVSNLA